ncbi:MAG: PEP/pyruvate-binding domain-containing protein [Vulcanimicrobiota bacterium]
MPTQILYGIVDERLTSEAFAALCGRLAGVPFVKVVVVRESGIVHFINHHAYQFHSDYIAEQILGESSKELDQRLDSFNEEVYHSPDRRYLLGTVGMHQKKKGRAFYTLETVEVDTMGPALIKAFYEAVKGKLDRSFRLYFKPNNHQQEEDAEGVPIMTASALFEQSEYLPLNAGLAEGRLRAFETEAEFRRHRDSLEWYDIIVMHRVPDDIPRLSGIINASHTTPLSHTNVLASGWQIPNAVQIGVLDRIAKEGLDEGWVRYEVDSKAAAISLESIPQPDQPRKPAWALHRVRLEAPDVETAAIVDLSELRLSDRFRYGTKAANLGELHYLLEHGSNRVLGFYQLPRPPRANLLRHLSDFLGVAEESRELTEAALDFLRGLVKVPRGLALPFSLQREFLESSPTIQQTLGKLKMALQLDAREVEPLCVSLQNLIRKTRMPDGLRERIDEKITEHLLGVSTFVVRSSSNAEDLEDFSAAGVYESINHITTAETLFASIKEVWASLLSPRSTRLRQEVGISLDDAYMGVILQEQVPASVGGVMVTTNPTNREDFRNVYLNASLLSVEKVVSGGELPIQYLFNSVEGGGRTLSLGDAHTDLESEWLELLGKMAYAGRLLQSHFSPDYTFSWPVDVEWLANPDGLYILQLRPYAR